MKVRAIEMGFYGGRRRREGDVFEVPAGSKAKWFAPVVDVAPPAAPTPAKGKAKSKAVPVEPEALSDITKAAAAEAGESLL